MRDIGYYWVKNIGFWMPAELHEDGYWSIIGSDCPMKEKELEEVGERLEHVGTCFV